MGRMEIASKNGMVVLTKMNKQGKKAYRPLMGPSCSVEGGGPQMLDRIIPFQISSCLSLARRYQYCCPRN